MMYAYAYCYPAVAVAIKDSILAFYQDTFEALWYQVSGTEMADMLGGDPLTLSAAPGTEDIPGGYAGTITCPNDAALDTADTDGLWFTGGVPDALSVSDLIDTDYDRTLVKFDDDTPYDIQMIGILQDGKVLTDAEKDKLSYYFWLWVFFWGTWSDSGNIKENRTF